MSSVPITPPVQPRLASLDALRGFDMCWILGLAELLESLLRKFAPGSPLEHLAHEQLEHVAWAGFHFEDAIFPVFLFLSGASMAFAIPKHLAAGGKAGVIKRLLWRTLIIFGLGLIYSGGLKRGLDHVRWLGVIQRIGIATAAAGILSLWLKPRGLAVAAAVILIGYWMLLALVPVPGVGPGNYAEGMNLANYLDRIWLPGGKPDGDHDPEGLLSTLPAVAHAILGMLAGQWLRCGRPPRTKALGLALAGAALFAAGWAWHPWFPVVKKLWSSSFVLVATGVGALALALFYWIIDIQGWKRWGAPFRWVGANPLTLYLMGGMGFFGIIGSRLVGYPKGDAAWVGHAAAFLVMLITARFLYRRGIFLRA